jgi:Caspase domain
MYNQAAILAINFSITDIDVAPLREELPDNLSTTYNWAVERHEIDCSLPWQKALANLRDAVHAFVRKYEAGDSDHSLLTYYFSGHGYRHARNQGELFL